MSKHYLSSFEDPKPRFATFDLVALLSVLSIGLAPVLLVCVPDIYEHDASRVIQILLLCTGCVPLVVATMQSSHIVLIKKHELVGVSVVLAIALVSVLRAPVLSASVLEASVVLGLIALTVMFSTQTIQRRHKQILGIVVLVSAVYSIVIIIRFAASLVEPSMLRIDMLFPGYGNYRFFNHVQVVVIPLLVTACLVVRQRRLFLLACMALSLELCWLFFTGGRATILAITGGATTVLILVPSTGWRYSRVLAGGALLGGAMYLAMFVWIARLAGVSVDTSAMDAVARTTTGIGEPREYLWGLAFSYIQEAPWFGIGPMHFAHRPNLESAHPHNIYLQIGAEWGLPMLTICVAAALWGWLRLLRVTKRAVDCDKRLGTGLCAAAVGISVDGIFSGNFVMPNAQIWIAILIGLATGFVRQHLDSGNARAICTGCGTIYVRVFVACLFIFALFGIAQGIWPEVLNTRGHIEVVRAQVFFNGPDAPRFWSHGWFK